MFVIHVTCRVNWVDVDGTMYKKPCVLITRADEETPIFGKLLEIYIVNQKVYLEVQEHSTTEFDHHYHCYNVQLTFTKYVMCHNKLLSHQVRWSPKGIGTLCVVPKHHIISF